MVGVPSGSESKRAAAECVCERTSLRDSRVPVVESAEVGDGDDCARAGLNLARCWRVALEAQVSTRLVVIGRVAKKHTTR